MRQNEKDFNEAIAVINDIEYLPVLEMEDKDRQLLINTFINTAKVLRGIRNKYAEEIAENFKRILIARDYLGDNAEAWEKRLGKTNLGYLFSDVDDEFFEEYDDDDDEDDDDGIMDF